MKLSVKSAFAAALAAATFATAYAQAPAPGQGPAQAARRFDPAARVDAHLARLKQELAITPQQDGQWQAFADAVKRQVQTGLAMRASMHAQPATTPERLDARLAFMKQRIADLEVLDGAVKQLYATFTPEQKATFERQAAHAGRHFRGRHFGPRHFGPGHFGPEHG